MFEWTAHCVSKILSIVYRYENRLAANAGSKRKVYAGGVLTIENSIATIDQKIKIVVVENSRNITFKTKLEKKYMKIFILFFYKNIIRYNIYI